MGIINDIAINSLKIMRISIYKIPFNLFFPKGERVPSLKKRGSLKNRRFLGVLVGTRGNFLIMSIQLCDL